MSYIKFKVKSRRTDEQGYAKRVAFGRIESDMADSELYDLPTILHFLAKQGKVQKNNGFTYYFPIPLA